MADSLKLYMVLLGGRPDGRHIEQHDIFFGIARNLKALVPEMNAFWPEARGRMHVDGWREVTSVDGYRINIEERSEGAVANNDQLFFINLGGYQKGLFDEPHFKMLTVQADKATAIQCAKRTTFYKEVHFPGATSHIDDTYGVDVDDIYNVEDILPASQKQKSTINIIKDTSLPEDELYLGYFKFSVLP